MLATKKIDKASGFSLMELLATVSILGIVAAISFPIISDIRASAKIAKLNSDLGVLNSATKAFLGSSGSLSSAKTPAKVLQKLKSQASSGSSAVYNGFRGSFIDSRTEFVMQSAEEGESSDSRLIWDTSALEFILKRVGAAGIKEVRLNTDRAESPVIYEDRHGIMDLAKEDTWIWDFTEVAPEAKQGTTVVVPPPTVGSIPVTPPPSVTPPPASLTPLRPPLFSIPSDAYAIEDYPLSLVLTDPNSPGASNIYYQVDFKGWKLYGGESLTLSPYSRVAAQAIPLDLTAYSASSMAGEDYDIIPVVLDPPAIVPDMESFGFFTKSALTITLIDTNLPGRALIEFSIENGPWIAYTNPFLLAPELFPAGAQIEARSISAGSPYYLPSSATLKYLPSGSLDLIGSTVGEFSDPVGTSGLVTNLSPGDSSSYFEWGNASGSGLSESYLEFEGATFGNIVDRQKFSIGSLDYYNGTIRGGTGASEINFAVELSLEINGEIFNPYFDFGFELINNPNTADAVDSADFVFLDDARSSRTLVFNDYEFEFKIEFGNSSSQGFTFVDQFHVLENQKASAELYGTFTVIGPASGTQGGLIIADDDGTGTIGDPLYQKLGYQDPEQFSKSLLSDANQAKDDAKRARDNARNHHAGTKDARTRFINEHNNLNYYKAKIELNKARVAERLLQQESNAANVAATFAEELANRAKGNALIDPESEDEAIKISGLASEARDYATEAKALANEAANFISEIESLWAATLSSAPTSIDRADDYARYLADKAKEEEDRAKSLRDSAIDYARDTISLSQTFFQKVSEGKFYEAESLYTELSMLSPNANKSAILADDATTRARASAFEATDIALIEVDAKPYADAANLSAAIASAFADEARVAADQAASAASQAETEWNAILSAGAADYPVEFAQFMHDNAKVARDEAKSARDEAKIQSDRAKMKSEEAKNKTEEGKHSEALVLLSESEAASLATGVASSIAEGLAFDTRSFAVQAEMIAASEPSAKSIASNATTYASEAEAYAAEATAFAEGLFQ